MYADTPQPALTGVFPHKYGRLYPAANFRRGISAQIWLPIPRSQLSLGYFYANMSAYTPQPALTEVFLSEYGCLSPALLPSLKNFTLSLANPPHSLNTTLIHTKYKKPASPANRERGLSSILHSYYSFIFASFFAWSAAMQASMISWISPFIILSSLYRVRLILWSVTLPCGKL